MNTSLLLEDHGCKNRAVWLLNIIGITSGPGLPDSQEVDLKVVIKVSARSQGWRLGAGITKNCSQIPGCFRKWGADQTFCYPRADRQKLDTGLERQLGTVSYDREISTLKPILCHSWLIILHYSQSY